MIMDFDVSLNNYDGYVGYFNLNYSSFMKTFLSTILCKSFIKHKNYVIMGHEDDLENDVDYNMLGYDFEENNYIFKSLQSSYVELFLSYKIERPKLSEFDFDTEFSLNAVTKDITSIGNFKLIIEEDKLKYLIENKTGKMKKAGLISLEKKEIEDLIKEKIESNYIYNLSYSDEFNLVKFNIIIEISVPDSNEIVKLLVALEYLSNDKILRLITMY